MKHLLLTTIAAVVLVGCGERWGVGEGKGFTSSDNYKRLFKTFRNKCLGVRNESFGPGWLTRSQRKCRDLIPPVLLRRGTLPYRETVAPLAQAPTP
tara:strand:- start:382 stop:669 length:288 start_codon:yes stop_codon:yes gene_type:complete